MKLKEIPKKGETYNCFDDGKIRRSRLYTVDVKEVIPFKDIDKETLDLWKECVVDSYWLYEKKTDFFIKTDSGEEYDEVFVRTQNGGWFSIGGFMGCGRLDINGDLFKTLPPE